MYRLFFQGSRANHNLEDYQNLATWKTAKAAKFKIPYQIFDKQWKNTILAGAFGMYNCS